MFVRAFVIAFVFGLSIPPADSAEAQVWLAGMDPIVRQTIDPRATPDYIDLFQPGAQWHKAAKVVKVFKTSTQFLASASDATLTRMFANLKQRKIALAVEALMLTAVPKCGVGVEGYSSPRAMELVAARILRLGGDLRYVAMDEPLDFGHLSTQPNACQSSLAELAADVAGKVQAIHRFFPAAQVGDIEGIGASGPQDDVDAIMDWAAAYEAAVGSKLSFLHLDVLWTGSWQPKMKQLAIRLHAAGIKFGIIYNGNPDDPTDLEWARYAEQRFAEVEADPALVPDQAILQTWMLYPTHMLPETKPGTMTWLVARYQTAQAKMVLRQTDGRFQGRVTDITGQPLAGVPITLSARFLSKGGAPVLHTRPGRVPPRATSAVLALRINAECNCSGAVDVAIGPVRYHDDRTGQTVQHAFRPFSPVGNAAAPARFQAAPGQPITQNIQSFPVTVDDPFTIRAPMRTDLASARNGYVAVIFIDNKGKEIMRFRLPFGPAERTISTLATDAQGKFSVILNPETLRDSVGFRAEFPGDINHRSTSATLR
jgi:hypothetical protein